MQELEISIGLIEQNDAYILQLREGKGINGGVGLIGCFGGQRKPGEKPGQTLVRELIEETSLSPRINELEDIGFVNVFSDRDDARIKVFANVFRLIVNPSIVIEAREGKIVSVSKPEVKDNISKMTPATRAAFHQLIKVEY